MPPQNYVTSHPSNLKPPEFEILFFEMLNHFFHCNQLQGKTVPKLLVTYSTLWTFQPMLLECYQSVLPIHKSSKLILDCSKLASHVAHLNFMIVDLYFEQIHKSSKTNIIYIFALCGYRILNFLPPSFANVVIIQGMTTKLIQK